MAAVAVGLLGSPATFASEMGLATAAGSDCAAQTWPNISAECAGAAASRKIRVISLDKAAPATVPLPESVQAAYASQQADVRLAPRDTTALATGVTPTPKLAESGLGSAVEAPQVATVLATGPADAVAKRAAVKPRQDRQKKIARAPRPSQTRYAAQYDEAPYYSGQPYGRPVPVQQAWREVRHESPFGSWFGY